MLMTIIIIMFFSAASGLRSILLNVALLLQHGHLGVDAPTLRILILHLTHLIILHHEGPGRLGLLHELQVLDPGRHGGGVLPGGYGAEVAGASTEEAGHGAGGGAEARDEHPAQITPNGEL